MEGKFFDTPLAKEYIYIDEISNPNNVEDYLPTFGPAIIDLYDKPYYSVFNKRHQFAEFSIDEDDANNTTGSIASDKYKIDSSSNSPVRPTCSLISFNGAGVNQYVGRLAFSIETKQVESSIAKKTCVAMQDSLRTHVRPRQTFIAFACINEASMIDKRFRDKNISFRLTAGLSGHTFDTPTAYSKNNSRPMQLNQFSKDTPIYVTFGKVKPCLYLDFEIEETVHILYKWNSLKPKTTQMVNNFIFFMLLNDFFRQKSCA